MASTEIWCENAAARPQQIARYRSRLSGPLRDRMDLTVDVPALPVESLASTALGECSAAVRARVVAARARQQERYESNGVRTNAELRPSLMAAHCTVTPQGMRLLETAIRRLALSARGYDRIRKVARTIADLAGADRIEAEHIAEALQFRMPS